MKLHSDLRVVEGESPEIMGNADSTLGHLEVERDKGEVSLWKPIW